MKKKKRVLVFNDGLELGGTEKLLVNLLNHLVSKKCEVTLLLPIKTEDNILLSEIDETVKIQYIYTSALTPFGRKWGEIKMIFRTQSFLKDKNILEENFDEIVCFKEGFFAKMFSSWVIPKTLWLHNILYVREYEVNSLRERFAVWLNKKQVAAVQISYALYDRVICVSEACKQAYLKVIFDGNLPIQDIRIVPNAVNMSEIIELSKEYISQDMSTPKTKFVLLTRVSPDKRIDRIFEASQKLKEEGYANFIVHLLGTNTESRELHAKIENMDLENIIFLHGKVKNPYPFVAQSNWSLCVSERESFSLALLESMMLDVPVITTDCGGPANMIENGRYGLLVDNSTEGVYEGMKNVLDNTELAKKYSTDLEKVVSRYNYDTWLKTVDKLLSI